MWHMQRTVPGWLDSVRRLPDGAMVKATGGYEIFEEVKAINPKLFTVHRLVRDEFQQYQGDAGSGWFDRQEAERLARLLFDAVCDGTFRERIAQHTDAISWHNEVWADSQNSVERAERIAAATAAVDIWNDEYRPTLPGDIKLIIGEAAPGNGMPREIARLAISTDNIVGYHPYEWWRRKVRSSFEERRMTSLRFDVLEKEWGLKPEWAFTEAGPLEAAEDGWRSKECLDGDSELYVEAVRLWIEDVAKTSAYKEDRIRGFALFTTFSPGDQKWGSFHTQQPEMNALADMIKLNWKPGTGGGGVLPPIVTPEPSTDQQKAWELTVNKQVTGQGGLRLNPKAGIQERVARDNKANPKLQLQIVTDEVHLNGAVYQAVESLTGMVARRVYVYREGVPVTYFEET